VLRLDPQDARFVVSVQGRSTATEAGEAFALALGSPAPNPSRGTVTVPFVLDAPRAVRLSVIDALGRELVVIADGAFVSGPHEATVDASALAPGVYTVRLQAGTEMRSRRVTVVR
ncbi:MAG: T9SS type A sorting domain-containing protein, partial [Bacteroidota bacterium]